ncbi:MULTISPECIES: acyltransferase [unclassified Sphingomonas]|uniref:acyltransferase n=1 Tax=unclassified Sphingomonas TaxID=196159 RepID=UPI0006FF42B1|nr:MULTISPECIES: acyltransferase [unclassified Sphingomonas]KQY69231.1 hypothetical protein ASD39_02705 [Sphingomonas sp. Root50]KRB89486.1 hypothetical protein ASE22_17615 [Sphingomonas sp. Root720]
MNALLNLPHRVRALWFQILCPLWFRELGSDCLIFGRQHFRRPLMAISIGRRAMIGRDIFWQVARGAKVVIGDDGSINSNCVIVASTGIRIGDNVAIAEFVSIRDQEHRFRPSTGVRGQGFDSAPIIIEDNCWIGRGVYIGPGSVIRRGSIVAANSVVKGEFPPNSLIAGAPARVKKELADE